MGGLACGLVNREHGDICTQNKSCIDLCSLASHADILRALSHVPPPRTCAEMQSHFRSTVVCPLFKETNQH